MSAVLLKTYVCQNCVSVTYYKHLLHEIHQLHAKLIYMDYSNEKYKITCMIIPWSSFACLIGKPLTNESYISVALNPDKIKHVSKGITVNNKTVESVVILFCCHRTESVNAKVKHVKTERCLHLDLF